MNTKPLLLCLLILWAGSFTLRGQADSLQKEYCWLHLDKSFYVSGEIMWFKVYLPPHFTGVEAALKVLILDGKGDVRDYFFLPTGGKPVARGYYKLPFDSPTGAYRLLVLAKEQDRFYERKLIDHPIPVFNDLQPATGAAPQTDDAPPEVAAQEQDLQIRIVLDREKVHPRDPLAVTISVTDADGQPVEGFFSASVTDADLLPDWEQALAGGSSVDPAIWESMAYTKGRLVASGAGTPNAALVGAYATGLNQFYYTLPNPDQTFILQTEAFQGSKIFQFLPYPLTDSIRIELDDRRGAGPTPPPVLTATTERYLELSRQRKKIFQLYGEVEAPLEARIPAETPLDLEPDKRLTMADYEPFADLGAFFREVSTPLRILGGRGRRPYDALMFNPATQAYFSGPPLFIVNGRLTRNTEGVLRMPLSDIGAAELFYYPNNLANQFWVFGNNGVVTVEANLPDEQLPLSDAEQAAIFRIKGFQPPADFPAFQPEKDQRPRRTAFFRPQVFWEPFLQTGDDGAARFSFTHTDDCGTFRIVVFGMAKDGRVGSSTLEYRVVVK